MENSYGIGICNRYELFYVDEEAGSATNKSIKKAKQQKKTAASATVAANGGTNQKKKNNNQINFFCFQLIDNYSIAKIEFKHQFNPVLIQWLLSNRFANLSYEKLQS